MYFLNPALVAAPSLALITAAAVAAVGHMLLSSARLMSLRRLAPGISKEAKSIATGLLGGSPRLCVETQGMSEWLVEEGIRC